MPRGARVRGDQRQRFFAELARSLRPGGRVNLSVLRRRKPAVAEQAGLEVCPGVAEHAQQSLVPIGGPQNSAGTSPRLEFINLHGDVNIQPLSVALPTSGDPDAIEQGAWYHVAVTYNGSENTPDNFKLYWTKLDPSRTQANEVFSGQMTYDLTTTPRDSTIGTEGRDGTPATGSTDGFAGVVDEIRISDIARTPSQFLFTSGTGGGDTDGDGLPDAWETTYFGNLGQTAGGDFDHDDTNNLAEYRLGLVPNSGSSRFAATHGAGGQLQWPSVTGVTFKIERSTTLAAGSWEPLENAFPGTAGTATYTDPNPPVGKAVYKVTLNP